MVVMHNSFSSEYLFNSSDKVQYYIIIILFKKISVEEPFRTLYNFSTDILKNAITELVLLKEMF